MSTITETIDETRVEEFAGRLFGIYTGAMLSAMIDIGYRTGLVRGCSARSGQQSRTREARWAPRAVCTRVARIHGEQPHRRVRRGKRDVPAAARTRGVPHRRRLGKSGAVRSTQHSSGHACAGGSTGVPRRWRCPVRGIPT